jgi:hypothetical protein
MNHVSKTVEVTLHGSEREQKTRSPLFASIAILIGISLSFLLAEWMIRIVAPQSLTSDIIVADPDVDYRLRPNSKGQMTSPEYAADIRVNSLGFRGKEISLTKSPGVQRVLFLGDSFTFGHGLSDNQTLPYFVGQELERTHPGKFEVVNGGVYGYSTARELNLFVKYGLAIKPDIVVTLLMIHNMADNPKIYTLATDGSLVKKQVSSQYNDSRRATRFIPEANWLREHSHLFKFVGMRVLPVLRSGLAQNPNGDSNPTEAKKIIDELSPEFYRMKGGRFEITTAILARLAKTATEHGARSILLTLGGKNEFENGKLILARMLPHEQLIGAAPGLGFSDAIALPPLLAEYKDKENLFFPEDKHWTAAATEFVAQAVADVIVRTAPDQS